MLKILFKNHAEKRGVVCCLLSIVLVFFNERVLRVWVLNERGEAVVCRVQ